MCSSRCLKDTCSLMALVWSLIGSCGFLWVFSWGVGFCGGNGVLLERWVRWGSDQVLLWSQVCFYWVF